MFNRPNVTALVAEFLGTASLVMVALVLSQTTAVSYFVATSVAITVGLVVMLFGPISGAHVNPAVTFGLWTARLIGTVRAVGYIAAQLLGGLAAWQLYQYLVGEQLPVRSEAFSTNIWLAEVIGAAIVAMAITAALTRGFELLQSALTYGAAFFVGLMIAATASAAFINPAIALGSRSWGAAYVLGPLVGGLIGVNLYAWLFSASRPTRRRK